MNFIWDIILQAQKEGKEKSDLFFWQAQNYSPYYEQSFNTINEEHIDKILIEINALYRFSHIFRRYYIQILFKMDSMQILLPLLFTYLIQLFII